MRVFCKVGDADKNGGHKGKVDGDLRQDIAYQFKHGCAIAARLQTGKPLGIAGNRLTNAGESAVAIRRVSGSAARIRYGVKNVVSADTATAMGYRKPLVTRKD